MNIIPNSILDFYNQNKDLTPIVYPSFLQSQKDVNCAFHAIKFEFNYDACLDECKSIDDLFCNHRSLDQVNGYQHQGWKSITLHGIDEHKTEHYTQYGFNSLQEAGYHWTPVCEKLPTLYNFLSNLPFKLFDRVRIMKLEPGGFIMPHTDSSSRMFGPLNIAINQPLECHFIFENVGVVPFSAGNGMMLDVSKRHAVINFSTEPRYHVIVHGHFNQDFYQL